MELISKDDVMRLAESGKLLSGSFGERAKDIIKAIPTVEERKEGKWIFDGKGYFFCSECKEKPNNQYATTDYCPNCGARMKGVE